jgi:phage repressor protein C with HTH and peptisase S24 domain
MLHLTSNLRLIRLLSGKTQTEFGEMFQATKAMVISYEKGKAVPDELYLTRVSKYAGVTVDQLKLKKLTEENIKVEKEEKVSRGTFIEQRRNKKSLNNQYMAPLIPIKAQAGYVRAIDQSTYIDNMEQFALPPGIQAQGAVWAYWEIEGDSMEPVFKQGDIILTSQVPQMDWDQMRNFYIYVIVTDEKVLFKRIYCKNPLEWVLISENEQNYPQQLLPVEYIKQVWVYRRTIKTDAAPTKKFKITV